MLQEAELSTTLIQRTPRRTGNDSKIMLLTAKMPVWANSSQPGQFKKAVVAKRESPTQGAGLIPIAVIAGSGRVGKNLRLTLFRDAADQDYIVALGPSRQCQLPTVPRPCEVEYLARGEIRELFRWTAVERLRPNIRDPLIV